MATLECAAQVSPAASNTSISGSVVTVPSSIRRLGASSYGVTSASKCCSAISIRPSPMPTRPRSRVLVTELRRNMTTPSSIRRKETSDTLKESSWTIRVVPTFAPSITASAGTRSTSPPAANDVTIRPVAVLLCRTAVTPRPAANALKRFPSAKVSARRRWGPNARLSPVCTIWAPQIRRAIAPARSISAETVSAAAPRTLSSQFNNAAVGGCC